MVCRLKLISFLLLIPAFVYGQIKFHPVVTNYPFNDILFSKNLCAIQDENGTMYFGTDHGLTKFDGFNTEHFHINGENAICSLQLLNGIFFVGSTGDFGYLNINETGGFNYISLADSLHSEIKGDRFRNIGTSDKTVWFEGNGNVFEYDIESGSVNKLTNRIIGAGSQGNELYSYNCFNINGELYAQNSTFDLYKFSKDGWVLYWPENRLENKIKAIVTPGNFRRSTSRIPDETLVFTDNFGIFKVIDGNPVKLYSDAANFLNGNIITSAISAPDNSVFVATNGDGIYQIDRDGQYINQYTVADGLFNNTVYSLYLDSSNNIWAGHEGGMSLVHTGLPLKVAITDMPEKYLGDEIKLKKRLVYGEEVLLQFSDCAMTFFKKGPNGSWETAATPLTVDIDSRQFEPENDGRIWFAHEGAGITRAKISPDLTNITFEKFIPNLDGSETAKKCHVFNIRGRIFFSQGNNLYSYDEETDSFRMAEKLSAELSENNEITGAFPIDDTYFWVSTSAALYFVKYQGDYEVECVIPLNLLLEGTDRENLFMDIRGNHTYFLTKRGIASLDNTRTEKFSDFPKLSINFIGSFDKSGTFNRLPSDGRKKIKTDDGNITVALNFPNYESIPFKYRFNLKGGGNTVDSTTNHPYISFNSLKSGDYTLFCEVISPWGDKSDGISYSFRVMAPWPLRWWAWVIYIAILMAVIILLSKLQLKRELHTKEQQFKENKSRQDAMIREQALIIANQGKKIHEKRLSAKSDELSEIIPSTRARQFVIDNLRDIITSKRNSEEDSSIAGRVLKELTGSGGDSRVFWDIYYKNFDLINEIYFEKLKDRYPKLSESDLKFCGLLRMELTTKEISKFTDLSVRGVETARYRLRKKIGLTGDQSLSEFLIELS